jgi:DNA-binding MarR family transcriptional regulator
MSNEHDDNAPERDESAGEWDDNGLNLGARLPYLLMLLRRSDAQLRGRHPRAGAYQGQGRVLHLLSLQSPIAQKELAYLLGIRSQSLGELLTKLEDAGLVRRSPSAEDRRTSMVDLTDAGRAAAEQHEAEPAGDPFAVLSKEEQEQLAALLDRVIAEIESGLPEGLDPHMRKFKQMAFGFDGPGPWGGFGGPGMGHGGHGGHGMGPGGRRGRRGFGRSPRGERQWVW